MKENNFSKIIKRTGNIVTLLSIVFVIKVTLSLHIDFSFIQQPAIFIIIVVTCCLVMGITVFFLAYGWKTILFVLSGKKLVTKMHPPFIHEPIWENTYPETLCIM